MYLAYGLSIESVTRKENEIRGATTNGERNRSIQTSILRDLGVGLKDNIEEDRFARREALDALWVDRATCFFDHLFVDIFISSKVFCFQFLIYYLFFGYQK